MASRYPNPAAMEETAYLSPTPLICLILYEEVGQNSFLENELRKQHDLRGPCGVDLYNTGLEN